LLFCFDDPGSQNGGDIATETQAQGNKTLSVQTHQMHDLVHDERGTRHITHILQKRHDREEYQQDGEESKNRTDTADYAIQKQP